MDNLEKIDITLQQLQISPSQGRQMVGRIKRVQRRTTIADNDWINSLVFQRKYIVDNEKLSEGVITSSGTFILPENQHGFKRRIDAEKYRLNALKEQYLSLGHWDIAFQYKEQLENIEEDHPEWLI